MNPMQLLIDTYLYFAKFPLLAGVQKTFNAGESIVPGYADFKTRVDDLANVDNSLCPEILDYIFAVDEKRAKKRIDDFGSYYLMVDYGMIQNQQNQFNVVTPSFFIALTVAHAYSQQETDDAEEILIVQECFRLLNKIFMAARADKRCPVMKFNFNGDYLPFHAPVLNNSIGWTVTFTREGNLQTT